MLNFSYLLIVACRYQLNEWKDKISVKYCSYWYTSLKVNNIDSVKVKEITLFITQLGVWQTIDT